MRLRTRTIALIVAAAWLLGADPEPDLATARERGAAAIRPFRDAMQQALAAAVAKSPEAAIGACRVEAPRLAREASSAGARVGRTSHKLRSPANAPAPWMLPLLEAYLADPTWREPRAVALDRGRVGYVEPIYVQPPCLLCHGESLAPELAARIDALYPDDRARGFRAGDFRGLFWAELDASGD